VTIPPARINQALRRLVQKSDFRENGQIVLRRPMMVLQAMPSFIADHAEEIFVELCHQGRLMAKGDAREEYVVTPARREKKNPVAEVATTAPTLLVVDLENLTNTLKTARATLSMRAIRDSALEHGNVAFAYAFTNQQSLSRTVRQELLGAGFLIVLCPGHQSLEGEKDSVDATLADTVRRHLTHSNIEKLVLVSDDRDFLPILNDARDRKVDCVVFTVRPASSLESVATVCRLPIEGAENGHPEVSWSPELLLNDLDRDLPESDWKSSYDRMLLHAPIAARLLRYMIVRRRELPWNPNFHAMLDLAEKCVPYRDRASITSQQLRAFLSALIETGVIERREKVPEKNPSSSYRYYTFSTTHWFLLHLKKQTRKGSRPQPSSRDAETRQDLPSEEESA
jgi:hypothetical protein